MRNSSPPASDVTPLDSADLDALSALIGEDGSSTASFSNESGHSGSHDPEPHETSSASATFAAMENEERPELAFEDAAPVDDDGPDHAAPAPDVRTARADALSESLSLWRKNAEALAHETAAMKRGLAEFDEFFGARMSEHERENEEWRRTVECLEANAKRLKEENAALRQRLERAKRFNHEFEKYLDE